MGISESKFNKTIKLKNNIKNEIYKYIENLNLIEYIKPTNILIMSIKKINFKFINIIENRIYCSIEILILKFDNLQKDNIIKSIYDGINKLHQMNIYHNNIKPPNILIDIEGNVFINDYCINELRYINYNNDKNNDTYNIGLLITYILSNDIDNNNNSNFSNIYLKIIDKYIQYKNITINELMLLNNHYKDKINVVFAMSNEVYYHDEYFQLIYLYNNSIYPAKYLFLLLRYLWVNFSDDIKRKTKINIKNISEIINCDGNYEYIDNDFINCIEYDYSLNLFSIYFFKLR